MLKKLLASIALCLLFVLLVAPTARAAQPNAQPNDRAIVVSPFLQETKILPTDVTKDVSVKLTNNTKLKQSFKISVLDFGSLKETGGVVFAGDGANTLTKKYGLANWIKLATDELTLAPGQSTKLQATIENEPSLGPGGHYAAVIMTVDSPSVKGQDKVSVKQKISSLIFASKTGGEVYDLRLDSVKHDGNWRQLPKITTLQFRNTGNTHVVPRGVVKLIAPSGSVASQGIINEASAYVLPETSRQLPVQMLSIGSYGWQPGTYHLQVDYRYDGYTRFASKSATLRYFNIPGLVAIAFGIILFAYVEYKLLWQNRRKKNKTPNPK